MLQDYGNFLSYICKAYKGTPAPSSCSGLYAAELNKKGNMNIPAPVCYTGMTIKSMFSCITSVVMSWIRWVTEAALE